MRMRGGDEPGDFLLLRQLCEAYGLKDVLSAAEQKLRPGETECGPGKCSNDCTTMCEACYFCPPDCALKR